MIDNILNIDKNSEIFLAQEVQDENMRFYLVTVFLEEN